MTSIERAKRYWRRIARWAVMTGAYDQKWDCQARVARALIKKRMLEVDYDCDEQCDCIGPCYKAKGLDEALDILDAVYGREKP